MDPTKLVCYRFTMLRSVESIERMVATIPSHPTSRSKAKRPLLHEPDAANSGTAAYRWWSTATEHPLSRSRRSQPIRLQMEHHTEYQGTGNHDASTRQALDSHDKGITTTATSTAVRSRRKP